MSILDARTRSGNMVGRNLITGCDPASGEPVISTADMAVLLGVPIADLRAEIARQDTAGTFEVPDTWVRSGRRRGDLARAAGCETMSAALEYLRGVPA